MQSFRAFVRFGPFACKLGVGLSYESMLTEARWELDACGGMLATLFHVWFWRSRVRWRCTWAKPPLVRLLVLSRWAGWELGAHGGMLAAVQFGLVLAFEGSLAMTLGNGVHLWAGGITCRTLLVGAGECGEARFWCS